MAKKGATVETRATDALGERRIPFAVHQYNPATPLATEGDSLPVDAFDDPRRVFRTQIADADGLPLALMVPISAQLDLELVAAAVGVQRATLMDIAQMKKATGYPGDAVSPIGMRKRIAALIDISAYDYQTVFVSAGEAGFTIELSPENLINVTESRTAPITRHRDRY